MRDDGKRVSLSKLCEWFGVPRSSFYYQPKKRPTQLNRGLVEAVRQVIEEFPTYGVRRIWAVLRGRKGIKANRKAVHRIIQLNGWQKRAKPIGHRPRVKGKRHWTTCSNQLWAVDTTSFFCGRDGWCHLTAVIDCFDREIVGWRLSGSGKAQIAAAALEDGLRRRGVWRGKHRVKLRSDNGLVFGAKAFVSVANRYGMEQEYITPYTPEQNGMIERFFRSLKEECIWLHRFASRDHAFRVISDWMDFYNTERVHSALGYVAPREYRAALAA